MGKGGLEPGCGQEGKRTAGVLWLQTPVAGERPGWCGDWGVLKEGVQSGTTATAWSSSSTSPGVCRRGVLRSDLQLRKTLFMLKMGRAGWRPGGELLERRGAQEGCEPRVGLAQGKDGDRPGAQRTGKGGGSVRLLTARFRT